MSILNPEEQQAAQTAEEFSGFEAIPAGKYACQLTEFHRHTSGTGSESLKNVWRIADGQKYGGRLFFNYSSLKPEFLGNVKGIFTALGASFDADEADMVGRSAWVTLSIEADTRPDHLGERQNRVKMVQKYDGAPLPAYQSAPLNADPDSDIPFSTDSDSEEDLV
jgi:hypothetical protein